MGWNRPTFEEQLQGMRSDQTHIAALATRWALHSTVVGAESVARQLACTGFVGRSVIEVVRANIADPHSVAAQAELLGHAVKALQERFLDQPLRDDKLTRWVHTEKGAELHRFQRVVTGREVGTLALYGYVLEDYASVLNDKQGDDGDIKPLLKRARDVAELVHPEAWALERNDNDLMPVADGTVAYLDIHVRNAVVEHGPWVLWETPAATLPPVTS